MTIPWAKRYAQRTQRMKSSAIREILKITKLPDIISFAGGMPSPDVFPLDEFSIACQRVIEEYGSDSLQYSTTEGFQPLKELICRRNDKYNISVNPENVLITHGSQQSLDIIGKIFINPGDRIIVENPTYLGAIQAWLAYGAEFITVETDELGVIPESLEEALRVGPKFMYLLPNFQNPMGTTIPTERRKKILALAEQYGVPIIEDDPYGELRFEGESPTPLFFMDAKEQNTSDYKHGNVIYLSSFSKILVPGIRLAWITAPLDVIQLLIQAKQGADLHSSTFTQMVVYEVTANGFLDKHVEKIIDVYRKRRDTMLAGAEAYFPKSIHWDIPEGGLFIWMQLPENANSEEILKAAVEEKVAFVPGSPFYALGGGLDTMRLNFSNSTEEEIKIGMERLGKVLHKML